MENWVMDHEPQIFVPYRTIGLISDSVPFAIQQRGGENFVTTCFDRSWQTYNCARLNLVMAGNQVQKKICAIETKGDYVFVAEGSHISVHKRGKKVATLEGHEDYITHLCVFDTVLLSVGHDHTLRVWKLESASQCGMIELSPDFDVTAMLHPPTYLNKILLGGSDGSLQLWNFRSQTLIHSFKGWGSGVVCLSASPALDVVGIGLQDGSIVIHNLKYDESVMKLVQAEGPATDLSFRTDAPYIASGTVTGFVNIWDLEQKKLAGTLENLHSRSIVRLEFLPHEPLLVTAGLDNALKIWVFDSHDPAMARLLRERRGHIAPPTRIRYYADTNDILSAGIDRSLWSFSTIQDAQNRELSQKSVEKRSKQIGISPIDLKLPVITDFASCLLREKDWDNILTCHSDESVARTWRLRNYAIGSHKMKPLNNETTTSVEISPCGNYGLLGTNSGSIYMFNMQSGLHRMTFQKEKTDNESEPKLSLNDNRITGLVVDSTNTDVASVSLDGFLRVWEFSSGKLLDSIDVESPIGHLVLHRVSGLAALASDDLFIRIFDLSARRLVRACAGHTNSITDISFSPDARWLCSSSADSSIRVYDIPTGQCVNVMHTHYPCTSLSFSASGCELATSHADSLGIHLWVNRAQYERLDLSAATGNENEPSSKRLRLTAGGKQEEEMQATPLRDGLVTLSGKPDVRWSVLPVMDAVRERNLPKEAPKAPESAPFFLSVTSELNPAFVAPNAPDLPAASKLGQSRVLNLGQMRPRSRFSLILEKCDAAQEYDELMEYLRKASPAAADVDYTTIEESTDKDDLKRLVSFFEWAVSNKIDYEMIQSHLHLFLTRQGAAMSRSSDLSLKEAAERLGKVERRVWGDLEGLFQNVECMTTYLADLQ